MGAALLASAPLLAACSDASDGPAGPVPGLPPTVLDVESEDQVLKIGGAGTIRGLNFSADASRNEVRVGSVPAEVTAASPTSLRFRVPAGADAPCRPTERVPVRVSVAGRGDSIRYPLSVASRLELAAGQDSLLPGERLDCREVDASGARYLLSLINTSRSGQGSSLLRVRGSLGAGADAARAEIRAGAAPGPSLTRTIGALGARPALQAALRGQLAHQEVLREMLALGRRLGPPEMGAGSPDARAAAAGTSADRTPEVGDLRTFRVPELSSACSAYTEVTGRVVQVTEHAVVVEDTASPLAGEADEHFRDVGREFEELMWPIVTENFGNPLALDDRLDDNGRLVMLFTPRVNAYGNVLGFVALSDFFPRQSEDPDAVTCAASDTAEIFYARAPTVAGDDPGNINTPTGWKRTLRSTVIHEVKHLASYVASIESTLDGGDLILEEAWLEESTAHVAEELYAREVFGYGQGENTGFEESVLCELGVGSNFPDCADEPLVMFDSFVLLASYLSRVGDLSMLFTGNQTFRGAGWWFLRWALDHAPVAESRFLTDLNGADVTGIANVEARMGRSYRSMLTEFVPALAADDRPSLEARNPQLSVPSWDSREIWSGLHQVFCEQQNICGLFAEEFPLRAASETYGGFDRSFSIRGGSGAFLNLLGESSGSQLLRITGASGGPVPANLEISVIRLR